MFVKRYIYQPLSIISGLLIATLVISLFLTLGNKTVAAPKKNLWKHWETFNPLSTKTIDHQTWQHILDKYARKNEYGIVLINYQHFDKKDHTRLNDYLWRMRQVNILEYNRAQQLAYWINLYNALIFKQVLHHYPISSTHTIDKYKPIIKIRGKAISLNDITNRIIRPIWNDPRILYTLHQACIGSPNLLVTAFNGHNNHELLNQAAHEFVNSLRAVHIIDGKLVTSKLYEWFREDFGDTDIEIIAHIKEFADPDLAHQLDGIDKISATTFNWHINDSAG